MCRYRYPLKFVELCLLLMHLSGAHELDIHMFAIVIIQKQVLAYIKRHRSHVKVRPKEGYVCERDICVYVCFAHKKSTGLNGQS